MSERFFDEPKQEQEVFFGGQEALPRTPAGLTEVLSDYYSTALSKPREEVIRDLESNFYPMLRLEAQRKAEENAQASASTRIASVLEDQPSQEEALATIKEIQESFTFGSYIAPDIAAILAEDSDMSTVQRQVIERVIAAERILQSKLSESKEGFWATAGYFVDAAASSLVQSPLGAAAEAIGIGGETFEGAGQLADLAQEAANLMYQEVSPEEFEQRFSNIIDRVADAGLFTEASPFYMSDFIQLAKEYAVGPEADLQRVFQAIDLLEPGFYRGLGSIVKAPSTLAKIGRWGDAKDLIVKAAERGGREDLVAQNTAPSLISPANPDKDYLAGPELAAMRDIEASNAALNHMKELNWGSILSPQVLEVKYKEFQTETLEALQGYSRHEIDWGPLRRDAFENYIGTVALGSREGKPYLTRKSAQALADKVGGEVQERVVEGKTQFVVTKEYNLPLAGLADETDIHELTSNALAGLMSTTARTTPKLDALIKRGEAQTVRYLRDIQVEYTKAQRKVTGKETTQVNSVLVQFRDDPLYNGRVDPLTEADFTNVWEDKFNTVPRKEVVDLFKAMRDISDVDYYINADQLLKEAVDAGETMVQLDGQYYRARKVTTLDPDDPVYLKGETTIGKYSDLDPERVTVYEIKDAGYQPGDIGSVLYVADSNFATRRLYHTDVLNYTSGGHRKYSEPWEFFIKQDEQTLTLAGGKTVNRKPITFMAVRTLKEAETVKAQFNTIAAAFKEGLSDAKITRIVRSNNDWNTSIETAAQFRRFTEERGLSAGKPINFGGDAEPLRGAFAGESTLGDSFYSGLNASKRRGSRPILGFGGMDIEALDPTSAIKRGFTQTVSRRGEMNYMYNAVNGWLKAAKRAGVITNLKDIEGLSPVVQVRRAKLSNFGEDAKALQTEQNTILFRMSANDPGTMAEAKLMRGMSNWVYGKGNKKLAKGLDWAREADPTGFLRWVAFTTKLGFFAFEQIYVQSSQILQALAITSKNLGTTGAIRGALATPVLAMSLIPDLPEAALRHLARSQAPFSGIAADDFIALRDWVKSTGRNVINRTAIEENNPAGSLSSSRFFEFAATPFNFGELLARLGAAALNFKEWRKAYPNAPVSDIFTDSVTNQMFRRQDVLTASMTAASSAPWQRSALAVPLQFTTFMVRMVEQIFTNRILTKEERVRLALGQVILFGSAGVPAAGFIQDKLGYEGTVDPNSDLYNVVRYGAIDAVLSGLTGEETALANRLAAGEGLFDFFFDLRDAPIIEVVAGPGGTITYDMLNTLNSMRKNIFAGEFDYLAYDWNRFARNITAYDRAHTLWMGARHQIYVSRRTEQTMIADMTDTETMLKAVGIPLAREDMLWSAVGNSMMDRKQLDKALKRIQRMDNIAARLIEQDDFEGASSIIEDIGAELAVFSAIPSERDYILQGLRNRMTLHSSVVRNLIRNGHTDMATKLMELTE